MSPVADPVCATLLVLVVTNARVILAADSRRNVLYADGVKEQGSMDKIFRTGDCYYTVSGFSSTQDERFSLQAIIHKVLLLYPDFDTALKQLASTLATELKHYLATLKDNSPTLFTQLLRDSHSGGEIVIVKKVNDVPAATLLDYRIIDSEPVRVVLESWKITTGDIRGPDDCFWRAIGNTDFLNRRMPAQTDMARHPEEQIKTLMQEGRKAYPRQIGGPLNMLEVTPGGAQWIEKSATAPNRV